LSKNRKNTGSSMNIYERAIWDIARNAKGSHLAVGYGGESIAIGAFQHIGWKAQHSRSKKCGDVEVFTPKGAKMTIEVKTARVSKDGTYQFCLQKVNAQGKVKTCASDSDYLMLIAITKVDNVYCWLIPAFLVAGLKKITLQASALSGEGKYGAYRQKIDSISIEKSIQVAEGKTA